MNILVLSWRDPRHPLAGGAEQVMHEHMKGWVEANHNVTFFSSRPSGTPSQEILDGVNINRKGSQYLTVHILAFFWYFFGKHPKFDLVIDQFHGWPFFTPLYIRVPKLAVIQELTRKVWFRYPLPFGLNYLLGSLGYIIEPIFFLFYRNIIFMTGSESAKRELQGMGIKEKDITVVPHGVIIKRPKHMPPKEKVPTIIFLGALASDKGIEDALKVFELLNDKGNFVFWVVGKGSPKYQKFLQKKARNLGVEIKFWGFVDQQTKFELLARAHVLINPSIREGWGLVNIEANTMGTPVVAYSSQGLIDSVKHKTSGILCTENTPAQMAQNTYELLKNRKEYNNLRQGAIKWSRQFSWERSREISLKLIHTLRP